MAGGITSTALVAASSNHGALGMIDADYMTDTDLKKQIRAIRQTTNKPF